MGIDEDCYALDMLHNASVYIAKQFDMDWPPELAKANFDARAIIFNAANRILTSAGCGITEAEFEGAMIIEREMGDASRE